MADILTAREINDLLLATLDDYGPPTFTQQAQELQRYEFMSFLLNEDRMLFDSGIGIKRTIMTSYEDVASWVGMHEATDVSISDHLQQLDVAWKHIRTHWGFDVKETFMNKGKALIANVIEPRRSGAIIALAGKLESAAWDFPSTTTEATTKEMYGIPYYVCHVTGSSGGFNGGAPSGHTTVAGVNPTTYPTYQNWTDNYADYTPDDWLDVAREAHLKTQFVSPVTLDDFRGDTGQRFRIYTNDVGMKGIWRMADQQNQNLGWDFGKMDNQTTFKGNAFRYVPKLDSGNVSANLPTNPFYFIDRGSFIFAALSQDYMRQTEAMNSRSQPDSFVTYINASLQLLCVIRRHNAVLANA